MNFCSDRNIKSDKKWVSRASRLRKKLLPNHFKIDDKTLQDFSYFALNYGKSISYFNENNRPDGDWAVFYRNDSTISLFFLQSLETDNWLNKTTVLLQQYDKAKSFEAKVIVLQDIVKLSSQIFLEIEQSIINLSEYTDFYNLLIKQISNKYSRFFAVVSSASKIINDKNGWINPSVRNFENSFNHYWKRQEKNIVAEDDKDWLVDLFRLLSRGLPRIIQHAEALKLEASNFLNKEVLNSGNVKPHIALFIAFYDLYQNAQQKLNNITERHLNYYFNEVLNLTPNNGTSDSVYLTVNLTKGANTIQLNKGTRFNYKSKFKNEPEDFVLDNASEIHEGSIIKVIGLNVSEQSWIGSFMNEAEVETSIFDLKDNTASNFGFEISSEFLILEEGERRITFDFSISNQEMLRFKQNVENKYFPFEISKVNKLIADSWSISYSNMNGWQKIEDKSINIYFHGGTENEILKLRFDIIIRKHELPCIPLIENSEINESSLLFLLNENGANLYTFFRDINFSKADLSIAVIGVKELILSNDYGSLSNEKPMEPFGPQPKVGASLYIGHKNLFLKPLSELIINLEWINLPLNPTGFKGHYKNYEGIEDNSSFKAKLSFLKDKNWIPSENKQVVDLFTSIQSQSNSDLDQISVVRRINELDIIPLGLTNEARISGPLTELNSAVTDGFIKMEFCYPFVGFGHEQYVDLVKKAAYKSVRIKSEPETINEPYSPTIKSIFLEYKSKMNIEEWGKKIKFRRINPFGYETINSHDFGTLLSVIPDEGSFLIGLDPLLNNKEISLLFKIGNKSANNSSKGVPKYKISYLEKDTWIELPSEKITFDSTRKLQSTGIFKLKLPEINAINNSIDKKNIWLRFDLITKNIGPYIQNLHLNPILIIREKALESDSEFLEKYTINSMKHEMVQVDKIEQPYKSFNGKLPEKDGDFRLRVSERIQNRSRAISNKDIEQIILNEFDDVQSLKCLNHMDSNFNFKPGSVLISVVPFDKENLNKTERYFTNQDLFIMQDYLKSRLLTGMNVSIVNPVYERIRIKFNVKFKSGYNENSSINRLHDRINTFLNPWTSDKIISYGGLIPSSVILNEIELDDSVDFVTNFSAFHIVNNEIINLNTANSKDLVIIANSPISVIIPDLNHKFLSFNDKISSDKHGINDMMIGNDFLIKTTIDRADSGLGFDALEKNFRLPSKAKDFSAEKHTFTFYLK